MRRLIGLLLLLGLTAGLAHAKELREIHNTLQTCAAGCAGILGCSRDGHTAGCAPGVTDVVCFHGTAPGAHVLTIQYKNVTNAPQIVTEVSTDGTTWTQVGNSLQTTNSLLTISLPDGCYRTNVLSAPANTTYTTESDWAGPR